MLRQTLLAPDIATPILKPYKCAMLAMRPPIHLSSMVQGPITHCHSIQPTVMAKANAARRSPRRTSGHRPKKNKPYRTPEKQTKLVNSAVQNQNDIPPPKTQQ